MKTRTSKKDLFLIVVCTIALILFFEPLLFKEKDYQLVDTIYDYCKLALSGIIVVKFLLNKIKDKDFSKSKIIILTIVYQLVCFLITIFNHGDIMRFIGPAITSIVVLMIVEMLVVSGNIFKTLKYLNIYFRLCFLINLVTIIISFIEPSSRFVYFLGIDNRFIFMYLSWMFTELLVDVNDNGKITKNSYILFALMEFSLLIVNTVAAMIAFFIWLIPLCLNKLKIMNRVKIIVNSIFLLDIAIVRFRLSYAFSYLLNAIGKFPHLSGRVLIWDAVFDTVARDHFLFGVGMQSEQTDMLFFKKHVSDVYAVNHAHNTFIDIVYRYGFVSLILFSLILYEAIKSLINNKNNRFATVTFVALVIALILGIFDTLLFAGFYLIIGISCNLHDISTKK